MAGRVVYVKLDDGVPNKPVRGRDSDAVSRDPRMSADLNHSPAAKRPNMLAEHSMRGGTGPMGGHMALGMMNNNSNNNSNRAGAGFRHEDMSGGGEWSFLGVYGCKGA